MFCDVIATGTRAWAPTSALMPPLYSQSTVITGDDVVAEIGDHKEIRCSIRKVETSTKRKRKNKSFATLNYPHNLMNCVTLLKTRVLIYVSIHLDVMFKMFLISWLHLQVVN